jgi:predicted ArsR family transcriptional regulator
MIEIERGTLEAKIIEVLLEVYPISVSDLKDELNISEQSLKRGIKKLQVRGIIQLEPLPDKVFIRLIRRDFHFIGRKVTQRKPLKKKGRKSKGKDYDGFAYG